MAKETCSPLFQDPWNGPSSDGAFHFALPAPPPPPATPSLPSLYQGVFALSCACPVSSPTGIDPVGCQETGLGIYEVLRRVFGLGFSPPSPYGLSLITADLISDGSDTMQRPKTGEALLRVSENTDARIPPTYECSC